MTLDELRTKWLVRACKVDCTLINLSGESLPYQWDGFEHSAPLGDFLQAYIEHISIPWYRKRYDWKIVKKDMIGYMNQVGLRFQTL